MERTHMGQPETITFGAVGDIGLYGKIGEEMVARGADWPFEKMREHLERADVLFGNMESVVVPPDYPEGEVDPAGLVSPFSGEECAAALKRAGFDFLNLAANHVLDAGVVGMDHTTQVLEDAGLVTAGVGRTQEEARGLAVVEGRGVTLGFLCYCEDTNYSLGTRGPCHAYYTLETVLEDVREHKRDVDVLVVSIHADIEFMPTPSVPRLRNFREIARAGADIILGHHPHVPQGCEMADGCLIAYSLGNFVFPAHSSDYMKGNAPHTGHSFLLLVEVAKDGVRSFERVPFEIKEPPEERPAPLKGKAREEMLNYLAELDAYLKDDAFVLKTWRERAKGLLATYIKRAAEADLDNVIDEFVGRLCLTAENRSWMDEILAMGREAWEAQKKETDPLHRPNYRFTGPAGPD